MHAASETRRHLGQILVEEGFLAPDALADALKEHERTQRPLGEVLVELGMVSPGAIANALAEQHGGLLRTEYGISAGLRSRADAEPESAETPGPESDLVRDPESDADPDGERRPLLRAVVTAESPPAEVEAPTPAAPIPAVAPDVLAAWRTAVADRDRVIDELSTAVRSLDADLAQLRAAPETPTDEPDTAELEQLRAQVQERDIQLAQLQAAAAEPVDTTELDGLGERLAATEAELAQTRSRLDERDGELAAAVTRVSAVTGELEALQARLASAGSSAEGRGRELSEAHMQSANFNAELQALRPRLAAAESELAALRPQAAALEGRIKAERDARAGDIESFARKIANAEAAVARTQARLEGREAELGALKIEAADRSRELDFLRSRLAAIEAAPVAPTPAPADDGPHVLFVPRNGGYELVERDGPPPARGEIVEADARYVVAKVGPSPRPGERRTCVYLVRA